MLLELFRSNRLVELESILRPLVARNAESEFLWGLLGTTLEMQGKDGVEALRRAVTIDPDSFDANTSLGGALRGRGNLTEAAEAFSRALASQPANPVAQFNIGETWRQLGRYAEAGAVLRQIVSNYPDFVEAFVSYADLLSKSNSDLEAEHYCRQAIAMAPGFPQAHFCLGNILQKQGRLPESRSAYVEAIRTDNAYAAAYDSLGCVLQEMGLLKEAERCHREALRLLPDFPAALLNLGRLFDESNRFSEAEAVYRSAVRLQPGDPAALQRLGNVLHELGRDDEADTCFAAAIAAHEGDIRLRFARTLLALPVVPLDMSQAALAADRFKTALSDLASWQAYAAASSLTKTSLAELPLPFSLAYRSGNHVEALSSFADIYGRCLGSREDVDAERCGRVRLLVVSHHIRNHSVWNIVLRGLLRHLDRGRFEVLVYHLGNLEDEETLFAKSIADVWRDRHTISSAEGWLEAAKLDRPDVIFYPEIGMASLSYMLAAHRIALLQVAGWGHPITSGLGTIDLYFSGALIEPPDAQAHYRERLVCLPGTGCCTDALPTMAEPVDDLLVTMTGRSATRFVVAQRAIKFDPADDCLFARIAERVPDSEFFLLRDPIAPWATDIIIGRLRAAFEARGADPDRQIVVLPWLSAERFLGLLDVCDIYLDCPSFSGYTTVWQALHRGIPVVTMEGEWMRRRLAAGLLRQIGLPGTIASSPDEYVALAVELAWELRDPGLRALKRAAISRGARRADGNVSVVRGFETALLTELAARGRCVENHPGLGGTNVADQA